MRTVTAFCLLFLFPTGAIAVGPGGEGPLPVQQRSLKPIETSSAGPQRHKTSLPSPAIRANARTDEAPERQPRCGAEGPYHLFIASPALVRTPRSAPVRHSVMEADRL